MSKVVEAKIELLLNLRFPNYLRYRDDRYYSNCDDYDYVIENGREFEAHIHTLSETELDALRIQEKGRKDEEDQKLKELEESTHFYNEPVAQADYVYWAKQPFWLLEDFVALSLGKAPEVVSISSFGGFSDTTFTRLYNKQRDLVMRAHKSGNLSSSNSPLEYLEWSLHKEVSIPKELEAEIIRLNGRVDWKAKYNELLIQQTKTDSLKAKQHGQTYTSPYISLMLDAIAANNLSIENQSKKDMLKQWFLDNSPRELIISARKADMMATLIRLPESETGGNKKI